MLCANMQLNGTSWPFWLKCVFSVDCCCCALLLFLSGLRHQRCSSVHFGLPVAECCRSEMVPAACQALPEDELKYLYCHFRDVLAADAWQRVPMLW